MSDFIAKNILAVRAAVATGTLIVSGSAMADLPAAIGAALTAVQTDGLALADLVWPVVIALFGATILFKLFKRFGNKI